MQRLILLRHAKTESTAATGGDAARALTDRGRRDAALIGRALAQAELAPDRVLVSSATRARQTWTQVAADFPLAQVEVEPGLYLAEPERLVTATETLRHDPLVATGMIIGHNPGLHDYALSLAGKAGPDRLGSFPPGCAVVFVFDDKCRARLEMMLTPRDVGGGAP